MSLYPQKLNIRVLSLWVRIQINLHSGLLVVTEADTDLSTSVGGQAERRHVNMLQKKKPKGINTIFSFKYNNWVIT